MIASKRTGGRRLRPRGESGAEMKRRFSSKVRCGAAAGVVAVTMAVGAGASATSGTGLGGNPQARSDAANYEEWYGVAALSPADVWAVGYYAPESQADGPVARHWNG